jgi:hypothetical protein
MFSDQMIVLTYVIREDAERRGYHSWLRQIDTPFFNSVPVVGLYENWKVAQPQTDLPWTHFDLLNPAKGVEPEAVFQHPNIVEFAANWSRLWGVVQTSEHNASNYQIHVLTRIRAGTAKRGGLVALVIDPDMSKLPVEADVWAESGMVVGDNQLGKTFAVVPLKMADEQINTDAAWGRQIVIGEIIASPNF